MNITASPLQPVKFNSRSTGPSAGRLVRRRAIWAASQPDADPASIAPAFEANQRFGSPLSLKSVKEITMKARPVPEIAHYRDPVQYQYTRQAIAEAQADIEQLPWSGASAQGSRRAVMAVLSLMHYLGSREVDLGTRDLAEYLGVRKETASRYLRALCGLIPQRRATVPTLLTSRRQTTDPTTASTYRLLPRSGWRQGGKSLCVSNSAENRGRHSAENARKMNTGQLLIDVISRVKCGSARELAAAAGVSQKVAELQLAVLRKNKAVKKIDGVYELLIPRPQYGAATVDLGHDAFRH